MKTSIVTRAAALAASILVTFVTVRAIADYALPKEPFIASALAQRN